MKKLKIILTGLICCLVTCLSLLAINCINFNTDYDPPFKDEEQEKIVIEASVDNVVVEQMAGAKFLEKVLIEQGVIKASCSQMMVEFGHEFLLVPVEDFVDLDKALESFENGTLAEFFKAENITYTYNNLIVVFDIIMSLEW